MLPVTLAQVGNAGLDTAQEITHAIDGTDFRPGIQELLQRLAHDIGTLAFQASRRAFQFFGECRRQSQRQLGFHAINLPLPCIVMQCNARGILFRPGDRMIARGQSRWPRSGPLPPGQGPAQFCKLEINFYITQSVLLRKDRGIE